LEISAFRQASLENSSLCEIDKYYYFNVCQKSFSYGCHWLLNGELDLIHFFYLPSLRIYLLLVSSTDRNAKVLEQAMAEQSFCLVTSRDLGPT
jgi:hypothetical protein